MPLITPPVPPIPTAAAEVAVWDIYLRAVEANNRVEQVAAQLKQNENQVLQIANQQRQIAAQEKQAAAQETTAAAMNRYAAAQELVAAAMRDIRSTDGSLKPTRADLVREWVPHFKRTTETGLSAVELATIAVDSYVRAFPGALLDNTPTGGNAPAKSE